MKYEGEGMEERERGNETIRMTGREGGNDSQHMSRMF